MCGITGFVDPRNSLPTPELEHLTQAMADAVAYRGPDDSGVWVDSEAGLGLGQRRLSIVDLSPAGHQPMVSACGRYVIVYNGEVYSHVPMRQELEAMGRQFRGHSDTEVILESCAAWGVEATVQRLIGMFAFALWDRQDRSLTLVRDRLGIKPLYWGRFGSLVMFGSELKSLRVHPGWAPKIDREAAATFLRHCYLPAPYSIYHGVQKLLPGTYAVFHPGKEPELHTYWDARHVALTSLANRFNGSDRQAVDQLDALLRDAVGKRMMADVPLGAFLSGGIDSSVVVALMQAQSSQKIKTFSIGFREDGYDEAEHARAVAKHLGTDHTELYVDPQHAIDVIPSLPSMYDEPFADSSQIPTYLVSELARRHVTVSLSGDGGDELFTGYSRYAFAAGVWGKISLLPKPLRKLAAKMIEGVSPSAWDSLFSLAPGKFRPARAGDKLHKLAGVLALPDGDSFYRAIVSQIRDPETYAPGIAERRGLLWDPFVQKNFPNFLDRMQVLDALTYLPDDILTKVDRASMAVSLEARVPLLDHRVFAFAWSLPQHMKLRGSETKWALRQVLYRYVPRELIDRPKMGFGIPLDSWLRGLLRDWAEDLLSPEKLRSGGILAPAPVQALWAEHLSGDRNHQYPLWNILMLQAWLMDQKDRGLSLN